MKKNIVTAVAFILPLILGVGGGLFFFNSAFRQAPSPEDTQGSTFTVEDGYGFKDIAKKLQVDGFVKHWWAFYAFEQFADSSIKERIKEIKPGEYKLSKSFPPKKILEVLFSEDFVKYTVRIPEGLRKEEVIDAISQTGLATFEELLSAINDTSLMADLRLPRDSFEGYFAPSEYQVIRHKNAKELIRDLVQQSKEKRDSTLGAWTNRALELGLDNQKTIILASIIEKESNSQSEQRLISSCLHNRIRIGMPLEVNSTLAYGLNKVGEEITVEEKTIENPYNTFNQNSLPPTPILNPSFEAIEAALEPAASDYLYFFRNKDGELVFSATLKEHKAAIDKDKKTK